MPAQATDILAASRLGIVGSITVQDILNLTPSVDTIYTADGNWSGTSRTIDNRDDATFSLEFLDGSDFASSSNRFSWSMAAGVNTQSWSSSSSGTLKDQETNLFGSGTGIQVLSSGPDASGLGYFFDVSATQTYGDRWITDKGYVDSQILSISTIYNSDGTINSNRDLVGNNSNSLNHLFYDNTSADYNSRSEVNYNSGGITFIHTSGNGSGSDVDVNFFTFNAAGGFIQDQISESGLSYAGDYSANFTNRSLIDKAYVDSGDSNLQSQITTIQGEQSTQDTAISLNTAKVSADGSIDTHSDVDVTTVSPVSGDALIYDGSNFIPQNLTTGLSVFPIWAEESGALSNLNQQWSFGNGATGAIGITMPDCEVFALSFDAEVAGTSVSIDLTINNVVVATELFTGSDGYIDLSSNIIINEGDVLGFRTNTLTGAYSDSRVTAWCGIPLEGLAGPEGPAGQNGQDGVGGVPNTFARVVCNATPQVNNAAYTVINLNNTPTLNTAGVSVSANEITLQPGTYEVKGVFSTTSTAQRPNQEVRMLIGGVEYSSEFGEGYIRSNGGHNEAKITYTDIFTISSVSTISFESRAIATAGTVVLDAGKSKVLIHKLA